MPGEVTVARVLPGPGNSPPSHTVTDIVVRPEELPGSPGSFSWSSSLSLSLSWPKPDVNCETFSPSNGSPYDREMNSGLLLYFSNNS